MGLAEFENELQDTVNKISLTAAVIVFLTWSLIGIRRSNLLNRVTLHFQILIAFIDILRHLSKYFLLVENETMCELVGALTNTSDHIYIAFNTLVAINAHLIFVSKRRPKMSFYPLYTLVVIMCIGIINYLFYKNGYYGRNFYGQCYFKVADNLPILKLCIIYLKEAPGVLYCGYVVTLVIFEFNKKISKLRVIRDGEYRSLEDENYEPVNQIEMYWKISMYSISCVITFLPHLVGMLIYDFEMEPPIWYYFFYRLCSRLPGITNFFFMLYDPNSQLAFREFFKYIKLKFAKKLEDDKTYELKEHSQSNKKGMQSSHDEFGGDENWKIEYDDGYRMPVQDHIIYL